MRVILLGDCHWGVKSGDPHFLSFQKQWFEYFFAYLEKNNIKTVIQAGDFFDVRQHMKLNVMHEMIHWFVPTVKKLGLNWISVVGNHDLFYRDSNEIHSQALLKALAPDHFTIHDDMVGFGKIGNKTFTFLPWMNKNNTESLLKQLEQHDTDYLIGHLELKDFYMYQGMPATHGMDAALFSKYSKVFSGHFHCQSEHKNILYLNTPFSLVWSEANDDKKGFWVLDTDTGELEHIPNKEWMTLFSVIEYDPEQDYDDKSFEAYEGNIVKVLVSEKPNEKHYKKFHGLLSKANFIDYKIIDTTQVQLEKVEVKEEVLKMDTLSALTSYIDKQDNDAIDKRAVTGLAQEYFREALSV